MNLQTNAATTFPSLLLFLLSLRLGSTIPTNGGGGKEQDPLPYTGVLWGKCVVFARSHFRLILDLSL